MALKSVRRVTFSLPKTILLKLEVSIPKNKRSKFVAESIEKNLNKGKKTTLKEIHEFWSALAARVPDRSGKTALEMQREDRLSH